MSKKANPTIIGGFVLGAIALGVVAVAVFGSGKFFSRPSACRRLRRHRLGGDLPSNGGVAWQSDTLANDATALFYPGRTICAGGDAAIAAPAALARLTGLGKSLEI